MAGILSNRLRIPPAQACRIFKITDPYMSPLVRPSLRTLTYSNRFTQFIIPSLLETAAQSGLVSLSSSQLGFPGNAFVVRDDLKDGLWDGYEKSSETVAKFKVLINPVVKKATDEKFEDAWETCPSLPLIQALCRRRPGVLVSYQDLNGNEQEISANGFLARVIQHEIDHLSGILMITTLASLGRVKTTDPRLEPQVAAFQQEIEKRKKSVTQLFETNARARKAILRLNRDKELSINNIIFTKALNAHFIAKFHGAVSDAELDIPEFEDNEYKQFIQSFR